MIFYLSICDFFITFVGMKDEHIDIERMVMESHYLDSLEREREAYKSIDDMTREDYEKQLQELRDTIHNLNGIISTLKLTIDSLRASNDKSTEQIASLKELIEVLNHELKKYQDYNGRHKKDTYGKSSLKSRKTQDEKKSRSEKSEECDNSHESTINKENSQNKTDVETTDVKLDAEKVKSELLDSKRGPRGSYTTMDAAEITTLQTSLNNAPSDMKFCGYKNVDEYNKISYISCTRFVVAIYEDNYGFRHEYYEPIKAEDKRRPHINVVPGTSVTSEMFSDLAVDRYMVMVPNNRESIRMSIDKFTSCTNTRLNWLRKGVELLMPIYNLLKSKILKAGSVLNIDETWTRVRIKFKGDKTKLGKYFKKYVWVIINKIENIAYFLYDNDENDSRGIRPIQKFLKGFNGTVQSDGYNVYKHLANENPLLNHVLCWAHVRARFVYAEEISKQIEASSFRIDIGYLYNVEAEIIANHLTPEQIKQRRAKKDVTETLKRIRKRAKYMLADKHAHYSDMMLGALNYMMNGWDDLIRYRNDGRYTIDNMLAERAIRPFTVSRNGSLHFSSEDGVETAMIYHTVIETAKMCGLEVKAYLTRLMSELINGNKDYESLIPANIGI